MSQASVGAPSILTCLEVSDFYLAIMEWIESLAKPEIWISLLTLTLLEIVLGIDNIIFISILSGKLPSHQQRKARRVGLSLALSATHAPERLSE